MLNIGVLQQGIVIDHIQVGGAMHIYTDLNLENLDCSVAIIKNARSNKMGRKDIIKIDRLVDINFDMLGVLDPNITINFIQNGTITEKRKLQLPERVVNMIHCKNPRCITSIEQELPHIFRLTDPEKRVYRCLYCEQAFKNM